jgi:hypothetical protein
MKYNIRNNDYKIIQNLIQKMCLPLLFILFFSSSAMAENMQKLGTMNVHYIALNSTFLEPSIAKAYQIERSRYNSLVNISVLDNSQKNTPAKRVSLTGKARNNLGHTKTLEFEEVTEGDAIYYLAQLTFNNEEVFHFTINVNDGNEVQVLKFSQKFYTD